MKILLKIFPKTLAGISSAAIAMMTLCVVTLFFSDTLAQSSVSQDRPDISKNRTDRKWIPDVWMEFVKSGPIKSNLPDFSCAGYQMGNTPPPDIDKLISGKPCVGKNSIGPSRSIDLQHMFDVTDPRFGAIPNDGVDDTAAIQSAIDAASNAGGGVVFLPKGRYEIHKSPADGFLRISHDNIIIRGEGRQYPASHTEQTDQTPKNLKFSETILHFGSPGRPDRIYRLGTVPAEKEGRHWTALAVMGSESSQELTRYTKNVMRGSKEVYVIDSANLVSGQTVIIEFDDPVIDSEHPDPAKADIAVQLTHPLKLVRDQSDTFGKVSKKITWIVKIDKVLDKNRILLSEPARFDQFFRYSPRILSFNGVKGVGIENLTIQSSWLGGYRHHKPYLGKDDKIVRTAKEQDYLWGGIWVSFAVDGWIRNVNFRNLTQGTIFSKCAYITASDLVFEGLDGHAGVTIAQSHSNLVERAHFFARLVHPVSLKNFASGNVITDCETYYDGRDSHNATDAVIDFHGLFPYENLFDNMRGFYVCPGGDTSVMPHAGVRNVFWNIEAPEKMSCYSCDLKDEFMRTYDYANTSSGTSATMYEYQPQGFFVGITRRGDKKVTMRGDSMDKQNSWMRVEGLNRKDTAIPSLYKAQRSLRVNKR